MLQPTIDEKIQLVPKAQLGSWGKGSSGGAKASETGKQGVSLLGKLDMVSQHSPYNLVPQLFSEGCRKRSVD